MRRACLGVDLETWEFCGENAREVIKGIFEVLLQSATVLQHSKEYILLKVFLMKHAFKNLLFEHPHEHFSKKVFCCFHISTWPPPVPWTVNFLIILQNKKKQADFVFQHLSHHFDKIIFQSSTPTADNCWDKILRSVIKILQRIY